MAIGELRVAHVPSARQLADVFTKGLPSALSFDFRDSLSVTEGDVRTEGVSGEASPPRLKPKEAQGFYATRATQDIVTTAPKSRGAHDSSCALAHTPCRPRSRIACSLASMATGLCLVTLYM